MLNGLTQLFQKNNQRLLVDILYHFYIYKVPAELVDVGERPPLLAQRILTDGDEDGGFPEVDNYMSTFNAFLEYDERVRLYSKLVPHEFDYRVRSANDFTNATQDRLFTARE